MARFSALSELAREDAGACPWLERDRQRVAELMKSPLREAKAAGTLRRDVSLEDVFLVLRMVKGAMGSGDGPAARAGAACRALTLLLDGLGPSGAPAREAPLRPALA